MKDCGIKKALSLYKKEIIMAAALLFAAVISLVIMNAMREDGAYAEITEDGRLVAVLSLEEDTVYTLAGGQNVLVVENGAIYMASADCPDKTCVLRGKIHLSGESIVCLPHKISVVIRGAGDGPDLVS